MFQLKNKCLFGLLTGTILLAPTASAELSPIMSLGLHVGGDKLAEVNFTDGSTESLTAGGGLSLAAGVLFHTGESTGPETQLTIGWQDDSSTASNGDLTFDRFPLEIIQFYRMDQLRGGLGLTYHMKPSIEGTGFASQENVDFDNAIGVVFEVDYMLANSNMYLGGRYTNIKYTTSIGSGSDDGSNIAFILGTRY